MSAVVAIAVFGLGALSGAAVGAAVRDYYATAVAVSLVGAQPEPPVRRSWVLAALRAALAVRVQRLLHS